MIKETMFSRAHLDSLKQALGVYAQRHRVVAENVANVETPGYRAQEYRFEELLRGASGQGKLAGARTDEHHLPVGVRDLSDVKGKVAEVDDGFDNGVNDVDVDREMTSLATVDLSYRLTTRVLSMKYRLLRGAIRGQMS